MIPVEGAEFQCSTTRPDIPYTLYVNDSYLLLVPRQVANVHPNFPSIQGPLHRFKLELSDRVDNEYRTKYNKSPSFHTEMSTLDWKMMKSLLLLYWRVVTWSRIGNFALCWMELVAGTSILRTILRMPKLALEWCATTYPWQQDPRSQVSDYLDWCGLCVRSREASLRLLFATCNASSSLYLSVLLWPWCVLRALCRIFSLSSKYSIRKTCY